MAWLDTCRAGDASMPEEVRDAVISYVRKHRDEFEKDRGFTGFLDEEWFCLLRIAGGEPCGGKVTVQRDGEAQALPCCRYSKDGAKEHADEQELRKLAIGPKLPRGKGG